MTSPQRRASKSKPALRSPAERNAIALEHGNVVSAIVRSYLNRGVEREDLVQEGWLGLLRGAEIYDPTKGAFTTIAGHYVRRFIAQAILEHGHMIRASEGAVKDLRKAHKLRGESDNLKDACRLAGLSDRRAALAMHAAYAQRSMVPLDTFEGML